MSDGKAFALLFILGSTAGWAAVGVIDLIHWWING